MKTAENPFSQICYTLMRPAFAPCKQPLDEPTPSRTESIRAVLRQEGRPMSAAELLMEADLPFSANTSLVSMLLKWDIKQGRVIFEEGLYSWNSETAAAEARAVREALQLLKRHGYKCTQGES